MGNDTGKVGWGQLVTGLVCYAKEFGFIPEGTIEGFHGLDR